MEKMETELKTKDESSLERKIYEAEIFKETQERKIINMQEKTEELKKKNAEKQNEIKELKAENEQKLNELSTVNTAYEKETDLRTKAESLLHLTEEKLKAQILLYEEEKEKNLENTKQIEEMKEKISLQDKVVKEYTFKLNKLEGAKKEVNPPTETIKM